MERVMMPSKLLLIAGIAAVGLAVATTRLVTAAPTEGLANNEGIFLDVKTFKMHRGVAKTDPTAQIMKLGARQVAEGAIIFRSGDKLHLVDAAPGGGMQLFQSFEDAFAPPG
jgi:hypothetical protein